MALINFENVYYKYPTSSDWILNNINMSLEKGKFYAVVGSNGSGKTTLCNIIRGFIPHFFKGDLQGKVTVRGRDITEGDIGTLATTVGYIFENPFNQISGIKDNVYEELAYGLENLGVKREEIKRRVDDIIDLVDLHHLKDKNPLELSGGQQQRVAFASILIMDTDIIVIDEPTSQLDPQSTESIFKIIEHMKKEGKTIILVEHKIDLIAQFADEVIVLSDGEIKSRGKTKKVLTDNRLESWGVPYTEYTKLGKALKKKELYKGDIPLTLHEAVYVVNSLK